ncbi:MAG: hypothetical protein AAB885_01470 [Patescibacteria group bacterium]
MKKKFASWSKIIKEEVTVWSIKNSPRLRVYNAVISTLLLIFFITVVFVGCASSSSAVVEKRLLPVPPFQELLNFKEIAVGIYDRIEYQPEFSVFEKKKENGEKEEGIGGTSCTIIHFSDGRAQPIYGYITMPYPRGTKIKILQNELSAFKIVKAE